MKTKNFNMTETLIQGTSRVILELNKEVQKDKRMIKSQLQTKFEKYLIFLVRLDTIYRSPKIIIYFGRKQHL